MSKKTNIKTVIRKMVREEVAAAIQEVVTELKKPTQQVSSPSSKNKIVKKKQYTSNSVLNEILNETDGGISHGTEEYPTMGGGAYTSDKMDDVVNNSYLNTENMNNGDIIAPPNSPEEIKNLFDRDYSGILKKSMKIKSGN